MNADERWQKHALFIRMPRRVNPGCYELVHALLHGPIIGPCVALWVWQTPTLESKSDVQTVYTVSMSIYTCNTEKVVNTVQVHCVDYSEYLPRTIRTRLEYTLDSKHHD